MYRNKNLICFLDKSINILMIQYIIHLIMALLCLHRLRGRLLSCGHRLDSNQRPWKLNVRENTTRPPRSSHWDYFSWCIYIQTFAVKWHQHPPIHWTIHDGAHFDFLSESLGNRSLKSSTFCASVWPPTTLTQPCWHFWWDQIKVFWSILSMAKSAKNYK